MRPWVRLVWLERLRYRATKSAGVCGLRVGEVCGIKSPTGDLDRNRDWGQRQISEREV